MKKIFFTLIILLSLKFNAQTELNFNKRFIDSEDKWVAFKKDKEDKYHFGFIYIDSHAGLTLNHQGHFKLSKDGKFVPKSFKDANIKVRLENNNVRISWIPNERFEELKIANTPEWLKHYKTNLETTQRLYKWGFQYNAWNKCDKALTYLEKAYQQEPEYKGLGVELAFSYNCLNEYKKAIVILKKVVKSNPKDSYVNKELIYAQIKLGKLEKASKNIKKAIQKTSGEFIGENIYNLLYSYNQLKDSKNTLKWIQPAKKWNKNNEQIINRIDLIEQGLK